MTRVRTKVYNGNHGLIRTVEDTVGTSLDRGVISIDGGKFSFTFSPEAWSHIEQEVIND